MADLSYSDATWTRFMREMGLWLRAGRTLEEFRRRFTRERVQVRNIGDNTSATAHLTDVTITTMSNYGTSTDEEGRLYVRFVANASNWDVHLYRSTGASNEVGTVTNVAASATGTIVEANSSGLTGTLTLGATVVGDITDKHQLLILPDWKRESLLIFPSDGTTEDDVSSRGVWESFLEDISRALGSAVSSWQTRFSQWATSGPGNPVARGSDFLTERQDVVLSESPRRDSSGAVTRTLLGFLPALKQAMADETTGSTQDIILRAVAAGSIVFDTNNTGTGSMSAPTPEDRCPLGSWVFKCVRGLGTGNGGQEEFALTFTGADKNDDLTFSDSVNLRIKRTYTCPRGGGNVTLARTFTKTGDGGNADFGAATTFTLSGETEANTDSGQLYLTVAASGSDWDMKFYKSSARNTGDLVAQATTVATAATSVQATPRNGSGLTVTFDVGSGPTDTNTATLDANYFSTENSVAIQDGFRFATSLTSEGKASRVIATLLAGEIQGIASSPQLDDNLMAGANTDLNYITDDI